MHTAAAPPAGPVHLNVPFREPLLPNDVADRQWTETFSSVDLSMDISSAIADVVSSSLVEASSQLAAAVRNEPKGIVVAGPMEGKKLAAALSDFSAVSGYPVLADPLSGARFGPHRPCSAIDSYDSFLRDSEIADALAPEIVIRVGAIPTSKPLQQFLAAHPGNQHLLIDPGPPRDPLHLGTSHLYADPAVVLEQVTEFLGESHHRLDPCWLAKWQCADRLASEAITSGLTAGDELSEGRTLSEIAAALPEAAILVVGNSMPVRDADAFIRGDRRNIAIVANRGANGIDGVISSALGAAAVASEPTVLVIGDLSFYHDMNGLFAAQQFGITATIVVLNNNGGGIFSFLPQAGLLDEQTFERLFGTPIGLDVQRAAELYGAAYARPATWPAFRDSLARAIGSPQLSIVEVITDRARNVLQHRAISARVSEAMRRAQVAGV
jgi:2-succinyl-5-enolpyruvyl-6-hydroxy-3-cyclohexene-1-carboxylate synthase